MYTELGALSPDWQRVLNLRPAANLSSTLARPKVTVAAKPTASPFIPRLVTPVVRRAITPTKPVGIFRFPVLKLAPTGGSVPTVASAGAQYPAGGGGPVPSTVQYFPASSGGGAPSPVLPGASAEEEEGSGVKQAGFGGLGLVLALIAVPLLLKRKG